MQHRPVHDKGVVADFDAGRAGVQVDPMVEIDIAPEPDVVGKANSDVVFDGSDAVHPHEKSIGKSPDADSQHGRYPPEQQKDELLDTVSEWTARLPADIETQTLSGIAGDVHARHKTAIYLNQFHRGRYRRTHDSGVRYPFGAMVTGIAANPAYTSLTVSATSICMKSVLVS